MKVIEIRGVEVRVDHSRTRSAYEALASSADKCTCAYCRNFRALGNAPFPDTALAFFEQAGINPAQPAETYEYNMTAPGKHLYGGEFYFFGEAPITVGFALDTSGSFDFTFTKPSPLAQNEFHADGAVCLSFVVELQWVIADAP